MKQITGDINSCPVRLLAPARRAVDHAGQRQAAGATHVLLACTELPIALATTPHPACIDATEALARSCLAWWQARRS